MLQHLSLRKNERGQTALETAIILIAFVVVASVFAFTILSAGTASTEKGEAAIYSGLENVQSSVQIKGAVIAKGAADLVTDVVFTISPVSGGEPINLSATDKEVVIGYRSATMLENDLTYTVDWVVIKDPTGSEDDLLEEGELAEISVAIPAGMDLKANQAFTLEIKPPTGGVVTINRTTPAAIEAVMELR